MIKNYKSIILTLSATLLLTACSDKDENKKDVTTPIQEGKIEISQNKDTYAHKVKETASPENKSYYYSYNEKKSEDQKSRSAIDANMRVKSPYEKVEISMLVGRLSKDFIVKCSACHNDYANGIIGPSLLEKNETEIFDSIYAFKRGTKINVLMTDLVKNMNEKEIKSLAKEIASFNQKIRELKAR